MVRIPTHRPATHPGEMLLEEFLLPMNITQRTLADAIQVPYQPHQRDREWQARHYAQHSTAAGKILWHDA